MVDPLTRLLQHNAGRDGPIALVYHAVVSGRGTADWAWAISHGRFLDHLDLLRDRGWRLATMSTLAGPLESTFPEKTAVISFDDGYANNLAAVEALVARNLVASWYIVTGEIGRSPLWPDSGRPEGPLLSAENLRAMDTAGMEIGSHSVRHIRLTGLPRAELLEELAGSRATLEDIIGRSVDGFAYPYGASDESCESYLRQTGYRYACTTQTGCALKDKHPYRLRRLTIFNHDTAASLGRKLALVTNDGSWRGMIAYAAKRAATRLRGPRHESGKRTGRLGR